MVNRISLDDFKVIMRGLKVAYPKENFLGDDYAFTLWYTALQDIPYPTLNRACQRYMMTEKFPPTIADIRQLAYDMSAQPEELSSAAWNQLLRALRMSYAPNSEEVWNQLPKITREIVGGYATFRAWGNTELSSLESVQRPMFIKRFEQIQFSHRTEEAIPEEIRKPLASLPEMPIPQIEEKEEERETVEAPAEMMARLRARLGRK